MNRDVMRVKVATAFANEPLFVEAASRIDKDIFVDLLAKAICEETVDGEIAVSADLHPQILADWLADIRSETLWRGNVPYAKEGALSLDDYIHDKFADDLVDVEIETAETVTRNFVNLLRNGEYRESVGFIKDNQDDFADALRTSLIGATLDISANHPFNCNLLLGYAGEGNSDFGAMGEMIDLLNQGIPDDHVMGNNSLTWLVHQQGYSMADVLSGKESPFLDSVREEMDNVSNVMNTVAVCFKMLPADLNKIAAADGKNLRIGKDVGVGIFAPWVGGGSLMGIVLEKDLILPKSMINMIQVEGARNREYSVDSVFGMSGKFWKPNLLTFTEEKSFELSSKALDADIRAILKLSGDDDEDIAAAMDGPK